MDKVRISERQQQLLAEQGSALAAAMNEAARHQSVLSKLLQGILDKDVDAGSCKIGQDDKGFYVEVENALV